MATSTGQSRATLYDGKTLRKVWQPGDGDGQDDPELVERSRKPKAGHPNWKIFTEDVGKIVWGSSEPPRRVYLDDKAVYDIAKSSAYTRKERFQFWPFDFGVKGDVRTSRPNRGRPAYEADGVTIATAPKLKSKGPYYFYGTTARLGARGRPGFGAPNITSSPPSASTAISGSNDNPAQKSDKPVTNGAGRSPNTAGEQAHGSTEHPSATTAKQTARVLPSRSPSAEPTNAGAAPPNLNTLTAPRRSSMTEPPRGSAPQVADHDTNRASAPPAKRPLEIEEPPSEADRPAASTRKRQRQTTLASTPETLSGVVENGISEGNLAEAQVKLERYKIELEILHRRLGEAVKAQRTKGGEIATLNSQVNALHKEVEEHKATILHLAQKMDQTIETLVARNSEVEDLKAQLEKTRKELEEAKTEIKTLKSQLTNIDKTVVNDKTPAHETRKDANTTKAPLERTKSSSDLQSLQKERDAFRDVALRLYASKVDQECGVASCHVSMHDMAQLLKVQAEQAQRLVDLSQTHLRLLQSLHRDTGTVLNEAEARMRKGGLADEWVKFEAEAMNLE